MDVQTTQLGQEGIWLPLAEAADRLSVCVKTTRRRVKAADLVSRQLPTQHGQADKVWLLTNPPGHTDIDRVAVRKFPRPGVGGDAACLRCLVQSSRNTRPHRLRLADHDTTARIGPRT